MKAKLDPITVLVAHAEPFIAIGVVTALREQPGLSVARADSVFGDALEPAADVLVTDYDSGMALLARRRAGTKAAAAAGPRVMMLTHKDREQDVRMALEAGAHGYMLLDCAVDEFADGMRALKCGVRYLCTVAARSMADSLTREALTPREQDVLTSLARGNCNKLIATELDLAVGTIKIHLKALMAKMAARSRTQVVTTAIARGLIPAHALDGGAVRSRTVAMPAGGANMADMHTERRVPAYLPKPASSGQQAHDFNAAATPQRPARYFGAAPATVAWLR